MSTKHKNQRIINDKETKMLRLWQQAISPADSFYAQMSESVFRFVKAGVSEIITQKCEDRQIPPCASQTGDYYSKLNFYYANSLRLVNSAGNGCSVQITDILGGIAAVIMSRLKAGNEQPESAENVPESPVVTEKNKIVRKNVQKFLDSFEMVSYRTKSELFVGMFHEMRNAFIGGNVDTEELRRKCVQIVHDKGFPSFFELYEKTMQDLRAELNEFFSKNAAEYYIGELLGEHEILKSLATVQIPALQRETASLPAGERLQIDEAAESILLAYRLLSRDVEDITKSLQDSRPAVCEAEKFEEFAAALLDGLLRNLIPSSIKFSSSLRSFCHIASSDSPFRAFGHARSNLPSTVTKILANTSDNLTENGITPGVSADEHLASFNLRLESMRQSFENELRAAAADWQSGSKGIDPAEAAARMLQEEIRMAKSIRAVFAEIHEAFDKDDALKSDESNDGRISQGIAETVLIKTESLDESLATLEAVMLPLIEKLEAAKEYQEPEWFAELAETAFTAMIGEMARFQKEDRRVLSAVKKYMNFSKANEVYAAYTGLGTSPAEKILGEIESKLQKFLKEQTLYEISTFEEIQLYSVSRLRESESPHVAGFVSCLDKSCGKIAEILAGYGITQLRPQIGETFNGREHEVLMAEHSEGFNKGEIIKLLNSGYKRNDTVILRANVIAAR